jgi:hypothetical protein
VKIRKPTPAGAALAGASLALALALVPAALAGKGGSGGKPPKNSPTTPLSLVSNTVWNSPNPAAPTWCLNEDDYHQRAWSGSLAGSFTASEQLCNSSIDYSGGIYWNAGGEGIQLDLYAVGALTDLTITSPSGDSHHAVLVGSSSSKGTTTDHYQVCYVPRYFISTNTGTNPLPGGIWTIGLSGTLSSASLTETATMTDAPFQETDCPSGEQNLSP